MYGTRVLKQMVGSPRQAFLSHPCLPVGLVNFLPLSLSFCCFPFFNLAISVAVPRYGYVISFCFSPQGPCPLPASLPLAGAESPRGMWAAPFGVSDWT